MDEQDKPRPKLPTLAGVGPSNSPPVVGAVGRPPAPGHSDVTWRMIFEPPSEAGAQAARKDAQEEAAIDDEWPDEPPTAAPVQVATVPSARAPATPTPAKAASVQGGQRGRGWLVVPVLALVLGGAALRAHRSRAHAVATPSPQAAVAASASAIETAAPPPIPAASSAPPVAEPEPQPASSSPPSPSPPSAFEAVAAKQALDATASVVARCRRGDVSGPAHAIVTFGNDGAVRRCAVSPPYLGTAAGMCVARALSQARVPAFEGKAGVVVHRFAVPAQ